MNVCQICEKDVRMIDTKYSVGDCTVRKACLPSYKYFHDDDIECTGHTRYSLKIWWPTVKNYADLRKVGKQLTREMKRSLLYTYWFLQKSGLVQDVIFMILPLCVYSHGPITHVQNGLNLRFLKHTFKHNTCNRCNDVVFPSIDYFNCIIGPCPTCGSNCQSKCPLAKYSDAPLPLQILTVINFDSTGLTKAQKFRRIRHILATTNFPDQTSLQIYNIIKHTI